MKLLLIAILSNRGQVKFRRSYCDIDFKSKQWKHVRGDGNNTKNSKRRKSSRRGFASDFGWLLRVVSFGARLRARDSWRICVATKVVRFWLWAFQAQSKTGALSVIDHSAKKWKSFPRSGSSFGQLPSVRAMVAELTRVVCRDVVRRDPSNKAGRSCILWRVSDK